tara:strand:- start:1069 stop:1257 length:189 start_codon:yes stop_codon:yes gene_type:complete
MAGKTDGAPEQTDLKIQFGKRFRFDNGRRFQATDWRNAILLPALYFGFQPSWFLLRHLSGST